MDWLTFIAQIVHALAWPAVATVLLFLLRPHFSGLAARLQSLKLPGGTEALFRGELQKASIEVEMLSKRTVRAFTRDATPDLDRLRSEHDDFLALSASFPDAAVMHSFQSVERVLEEIGEKLGITRGQPRRVIEVLRQRELIDASSYDLYRRLSNLRNIAVHKGGVNITQDEALEFRALADSFVAWLRALLSRMKGESAPNRDNT